MESLYDRALLEVKNDGNFQKKFDICYNFIYASLWAMAFNNILLILTVIPHSCELPARPNNISEHDWKVTHIPIVKTPDGTEKISDCLIYTNLETNETTACDKFVYDQTWFETTAPSDNNWVCEHDINVVNIFAYSRTGEIVGSLFFGWFGDVYGRKLTYITSLIMLVLGRFISLVFSSSYALFAIGCIIASFPSWSATQSLAITSLEISSPRRRATVAQARLVAISFGMCIMPFFYWWLRDWKLFLVITTASQLLYLIFSWKLIESPQWLWINGKSKESLKCLKHIAKINKTTLNADLESEILTQTSVTRNITEVLGPLALFTNWRIAFNTVLQLAIWFAVSTNYMVTVMSSGEKSGGNPFLDFAGQSLAEIPGYFIAAWLADRIGRRYTGIISFLITISIWIIYGYRETSSALWIKNEWLATILAVTNRCSITVSYYIIDLLNMEIYPTCLRQSGMSLSNMISGAGSSFGHYILHLRRLVDVRYPSVILTITTLIGGVVSIFFLPETLNVKLPETIEDAKKFGFFKTSTEKNENHVKTEQTQLFQYCTETSLK